ncbi:MAG: 50S ribosomal protein L21 [Deltaproteobacteria bacterium]|nr:50S ribosomal protein L21 [Deltaproteobacteria bacterium]
MKYAVVEVGGKQYKVSEGKSFLTEKIELPEGEKSLTLNTVLMARDNDRVLIGAPHVQNAAVQCEVMGEAKDKKIVVYRYRLRTGFHRKQGHRQKKTRLMVREIQL